MHIYDANTIDNQHLLPSRTASGRKPGPRSAAKGFPTGFEISHGYGYGYGYAVFGQSCTHIHTLAGFCG